MAELRLRHAERELDEASEEAGVMNPQQVSAYDETKFCGSSLTAANPLVLAQRPIQEVGFL